MIKLKIFVTVILYFLVRCSCLGAWQEMRRDKPPHPVDVAGFLFLWPLGIPWLAYEFGRWVARPWR